MLQPTRLILCRPPLHLDSQEAAFLKKSGAKNFCYSCAGRFEHHRPGLKKVFLLLFLQKKKHLLNPL
jgi:hypothetical protein